MKIDFWRKFLRKKKIVGFTCGAFDLCHAGHVRMFKECKKHCDYLIVGVQGDPSIDRPAKNIPIQSHAERLEIMSSIRFIDEVIPYNTEEDLYRLLKGLKEQNRVDIRFLDEDWRDKQFTGWDLDFKLYFNDRSHGFSTSELRRRIYLVEKNKMLMQESANDPENLSAETADINHAYR
ncbi:MAG: adenylyltransferase/cytidyltransferase family protein [Patescibacteria group bacterium]|nr:adenylyltransferase/cytidyltransferase family protein [Patescibacteria group bacterium]MCL5262021.1 adenylyltransferase/cytidyltransferase family protein [Patescibacteria group bacterium]